MDEIKTINDLVTDLLTKIGIKATVETKKEEDLFNIFIDSEDNALLIGKHGNTLSSLEIVLSLMYAKIAGEHKRLIIEIGGYRSEREEYLKQLVLRLKEDVAVSGYEKSVRDLKPWERRFVHILLKEDEQVTTESTGEGKDRVLVIKKKQ